MKRPELCIGIDVGTSSLKALAVSRDGAVVATASIEYEFDSPRPGWTETHPDIWCAPLVKRCEISPLTRQFVRATSSLWDSQVKCMDS